MSAPVIVAIAVEGRTNPRNLLTQTPRFTWSATTPNGALTGFELRVSESSAAWGTDGFVGEVWNTGPYLTPAPYEAVFGFDGRAFPGCFDPKYLEATNPGPIPRDMPRSNPVPVTYYFQLQVQDSIAKSDWAVGFFMMDSPPTAINLRIVPPVPFHSQDLEGLWDFVSNEGGAPGALTRIQWFRNGVAVPSLANQLTVPSSLLVPGDQWYFTVEPSDGVLYGALATSPTVTVQNRPPQASALAISPATPRTADNLEAIFAVSDPDNDSVQATIRWYRNGSEQSQLRNAKVVPGSFVRKGDSWYFTVLPTDGFVNGTGSLATSPVVTVQATPPKVLAMRVENKILPLNVKSANPKFSWTYQDVDAQPQQQYQFAIGTQPLRTGLGGAQGALAGTSVSNGIVSTASSATPVTVGDDVFDSGVVGSSSSSFQYATSDFVPGVALGVGDFVPTSTYGVAPGGQFIALAPGQSSGAVSARFPGAAGLYDVSLSYDLDPTRRSTYAVLVNGVQVGQFTSGFGSGPATYQFPAAGVPQGATITVSGASADVGAPAEFSGLGFAPVVKFEIEAADFQSLSGYVPDGNGGIKLAGLAGSASTPFPFPSGTYDVELEYTTETTGNPTLSLSVNAMTILAFAYEAGAATRTRFVQGVAISSGDAIKVLGTRNAGAQARVSSVTFRPTVTAQTGAALRPGFRYYGSVRVFDGDNWSDWFTTAFSMDGFAWSSVSNSTGWTIEARMSVQPQTKTLGQKIQALAS
jgi:hypothetical protein